jgi:hypothetical protein
MSRLITEWRDRKDREDEQLHGQLRAALLAGRIEVFTDARVLDFEGSPVRQHWDHLLPLTVLMTLALVVLLAAGVAVGIVVMTLIVLAHLFGNRHYVAWRLRTRALAYMAEGTAQFQALWQLGGVALVVKGGNEPPCLAPKGDWRKFIRRNLGGGEAQAPSPPREGALTVAPEPPPPPPPPVIDAEPEPEPPPQPQPGERWDSVNDPAPRDEVVP